MAAVLACSVDGVHSCATPADEHCLLCVIAVAKVWLVRTSLFASLQMRGELPAAFSAELGQQYSDPVEGVAAYCVATTCWQVLHLQMPPPKLPAWVGRCNSLSIVRRCVIVKPSFRSKWGQHSSTSSSHHGATAEAAVAADMVRSVTDAKHMWHKIEPVAGRQRSVAGLWEVWQRSALQVFAQLFVALRLLGLLPQDAAGGTGPGVTADATAGSSSSSSSSSAGLSSIKQTKWAYFLELGIAENQSVVEATAALDNSPWADVLSRLFLSDKLVADVLRTDSGVAANRSAGTVPAEHAARNSQLYTTTLELCRAVVAAAPLPLGCSNPGCENMTGVSEASAARKVCAGCRCRYCSAACQVADRRKHKHACRRMAAAGQACS
jgi:hypothetical protein